MKKKEEALFLYIVFQRRQKLNQNSGGGGGGRGDDKDFIVDLKPPPRPLSPMTKTHVTQRDCCQRTGACLSQNRQL